MTSCRPTEQPHSAQHQDSTEADETRSDRAAHEGWGDADEVYILGDVVGVSDLALENPLVAHLGELPLASIYVQEAQGDTDQDEAEGVIRAMVAGRIGDHPNLGTV